MEEKTIKTTCIIEKSEDRLKIERIDEYADGNQTHSTIQCNIEGITLQMQ